MGIFDATLRCPSRSSAAASRTRHRGPARPRQHRERRRPRHGRQRHRRRRAHWRRRRRSCRCRSSSEVLHAAGLRRTETRWSSRSRARVTPRRRSRPPPRPRCRAAASSASPRAASSARWPTTGASRSSRCRRRVSRSPGRAAAPWRSRRWSSLEDDRLFPGAREWIELAVEQLRRRRDKLAAAGNVQDLARRIGRTFPLIHGGGGVGGAAATRLRCQVNENAKSPGVLGRAARGVPQRGLRVGPARRRRPGSSSRW